MKQGYVSELGYDLKSSNEAKLASKKFYDYRSVICGRTSDESGEVLDGCHIYPAGQFVELAKLPANILPMFRSQHFHLDNVVEDNRIIRERTPHERIEMIIESIDIDNYETRVIVLHQLDVLEYIRKHRGLA